MTIKNYKKEKKFDYKFNPDVVIDHKLFEALVDSPLDQFKDSKEVTDEENKNCCICSAYVFDRSSLTFVKYSSCFDCYCEHIEDREERWNSGWRPED